MCVHQLQEKHISLLWYSEIISFKIESYITLLSLFIEKNKNKWLNLTF